jgi:hypothetical protein
MAQVQSMSPAAVGARWKQFVQQASAVLLRMSVPAPDAASLDALQRLVLHTGSMCHYVALLCREVMPQVRLAGPAAAGGWRAGGGGLAGRLAGWQH